MVAIVLALIALACAPMAEAVPSLTGEIAPGVYMVHDDTGEAWGGWTMGVTHMSHPTYQAKKVLDLGDLPEAVWAQVREVRLSAFIMVYDYSGHQNPPVNGLDEAFEVVVNGTVHTYPTSGGMPEYRDGALNLPDWFDFELPRNELVRGANEIIFRKAPSERNDDYVYVGIDAITPRGNSSVSFDGQTWTQEKLTIPGGNGEYMVRLYLIAAETAFAATWDATTGELNDPPGLVLYAGAHGAEGGRLTAGQTARMEWAPGALDVLKPASVIIDASGPVQIAWLKESGAPGEPSAGPTLELPVNRTEHVSGVVVTAGEGGAQLQRMTVRGAVSYHPRPEPIDMAPVVAAPPPPGPPRPPACEMTDDAATLSNGAMRARFEFGERLRLVSLYHELARVEMARSPADVALFVV
ncbi:MAG TPA: hypothetical protein VM283_06210, partial [Armatimonadota bacterium]|nr:hypothetical protein [Armatimonadota bacterium]